MFSEGQKSALLLCKTGARAADGPRAKPAAGVDRQAAVSKRRLARTHLHFATARVARRRNHRIAQITPGEVLAASLPRDQKPERHKKPPTLLRTLRRTRHRK